MYSAQGMFGATGVKYERSVNGVKVGGWDFDGVRMGHFTVGDFLRFMVYMIAMPFLFLVVRMAAAVGRYYYDYHGMWVVARALEKLVGTIFVASIITILSSSFFVWRGRPTVVTSCVASAMLPVAFVACLKSDPVSAATVATSLGVFSWWRNGAARGGHLNSRVFFGLTIYVYLVSYTVVGSIMVAAVACWFGYSDMDVGAADVVGKVSLATLVDQTSVEVNNGVKAMSEDLRFAGAVVPLKYGVVTDDALRLSTRIVLTSYDRQEFRRWAQLGDSLLNQALVLYGMDTQRSVATMSDWKQLCLTRAAMAANVYTVGGHSERVVDANGKRASGVASEIVEALVGLAWWYGYDKGRDLSWHGDVVLFMQERLKLPRV